MESSHTLQDYIKLCAECKDIAVEVHPSYKQQYADVATMIRLPANLMTALIDDQHLYMECKKKTLERMLSAIGLSVKSVASTASVSASGQHVSALDPPCALPAKRVTEVVSGRQRRSTGA